MKSNLPLLGTACVFLAFTIACGDNIHGADIDSGVRDSTAAIDSNTENVPRVISNLPLNNAMNVPLNGGISATFSIAMDRATLIDTTFVLATQAGGVAVAGAVVSTSTTIAFVPTAPLTANTTYVARVTVAAKSAMGIALAMPHEWSFRTGTTTIPLGVPVDLGSSSTFVLLAKSGITNVPTSMIVGDIGVSPITATAITGLPLTPDSSTQFATTPQVTGRVYAANYGAPTPTNLTTAVSDMETAFTAAAARAPDVTELGAGMIGTVTLAPGVYKWSTGLLIPTSITLSGSSTDVWIFQIAQDLTLSTGTHIYLAGGAASKNVFWQVSGQVTANAGAHLEGTVLSQTAATFDTGASLNGRLLAQTLVTVRGATIHIPAP